MHRQTTTALLSICCLTVLALPVFDEGIKVCRIHRSSHGLVSSKNFINRLYTLQGGNVLAIDKDTGETMSTITPQDVTGAPWDSITVGDCYLESELDCVYVIRKTDKGAQILKSKEPELSSSDRFVSPEVESLTITLSPSHSPSDDVFILVDSDSNIILLSEEDSTYYSYMVSPVHWKSDYAFTEFPDSRREVKLQQEVKITSLDWNDNDNMIILLDVVSNVYMFDVTVDSSIIDALEGKPHLLDTKLSKKHRLDSLCFDYSVSGMVALTEGKHHKNIYRFNEAAPDVPTLRDGYQRDESSSPVRSDSRYAECVDSNIHCSTWAKNGMCLKRKSYMTSTCPKSCSTCQEKMRMVSQQSASCTDKSHLCPVWAGHGSCDTPSSRDYMMQSCKKSCNACPGSAGAVDKMCRDMHQYCHAWANAGRCESRSDYMEKNCAASCGRCSGSVTSEDKDNGLQSDQAATSDKSGCKDRSKYCGSWADNNKCEDRQDYMFSECPASCGLCGVKKTDNKDQNLQHESAKCADSSEYCLIWAAHGLCEAKRRYMSKSCRSACGLCEPRYQAASGLACEDTHDFCTTWSNYGMCTLKPVYMKENCAKSCGKCASEETDSNRILGGDLSSEHQSQASSGRSGEVTANRNTDNKSESSEEQQETCVDSNQHCTVWAEGGYCDTRADYMKVYCQASCKICTATEESRTESISQGRANNDRETNDRRTDDRSQSGDRTGEGASREEGSHANTNSGTSDKVEVSKCKDTRPHCSRWAEAGYCDSRSDIMHSLCPSSCNTCQSKLRTTTQPPTTTRTTTTTTTTTTTQRPTRSKVIIAQPVTQSTIQKENKKCEDISTSRCETWKTAGQCEKSQYYMRTNCPKTCGHCETSSETTRTAPQRSQCTDKNKYCSLWARSKRCDLYEGYMRRNCALSCGHCSDGSSVTTKSEATCEDQYANYCGKWAEKGYCTIRQEFMSSKCKKSCDLC